MKKLKKLKLSELSKVQLDERKISRILGGGPGDPCQCGCMYEDFGGSSSGGNDSANAAGGLNSGSCPSPQSLCSCSANEHCYPYPQSICPN